MGKQKPKLSEEQEEVLYLFTKEFLTPKKIAIRRNTSLTAVYKTIKKLKEKEYHIPSFKKIEIIIEKDNYCYFCDCKNNLQKHHIIRRKQKGLDNEENLIILCRKHHWFIHSGEWYLMFSKGYYYLRERISKRTIPPTKKQLNFKRVPPYNSLNNAIKNNKLCIIN